MMRMMDLSLHLVRVKVERTGEDEGSAWKCLMCD